MQVVKNTKQNLSFSVIRSEEDQICLSFWDSRIIIIDNILRFEYIFFMLSFRVDTNKSLLFPISVCREVCEKNIVMCRFHSFLSVIKVTKSNYVLHYIVLVICWYKSSQYTVILQILYLNVINSIGEIIILLIYLNMNVVSRGYYWKF